MCTMVTATAISILLYITSLCMHPSLAVSDKAVDKEGLYQSILREYNKMASETFGWQRARRSINNCKNACVTGENKGRELPTVDCQCDKQCVVFGDCCLDYWESCNFSFTEAYDQQRIFSCLAPKFRLAKSNKTVAVEKVGYQVVVRCPSFYQNLSIKKFCEEPVDDNVDSIPFVEGADGRTYINKYCANCHGVSEWRRWETGLKCPKETPFDIPERLRDGNFTFTAEERIIIREQCHVRMEPVNNSRPTPCRRAILCENKTNTDYEKCLAYKRLLFTFVPNTLPFFNPHCVRCNNIDFGTLVLVNMIASSPGYSSLGILFDFTKASLIYGSGKSEIKVNIKVIQCGIGNVYDFKLKACRSQRKAITLKNWTCELENETFPNTSDYIIVLTNRSIFVAAHNRTYGSKQYHWHGGNVTVCGNFTKSATFFLESVRSRITLHSNVEYYITLVGFSLSILALLAVITTYFLFSELQTFPGKIIINLAVALLLTQLVLLFDMVTDVSSGFCFGIAIVLHYLFIASFCWMNVMAIDVSRTFAGKSHRSPSSSRGKVFLFSLFYGWGVPLIIVAMTLAMNQFGVLHVGYGNEYVCWITNPIALAVFFVAPVVLMLLFNIVALVRVVVAVRRVRKVTKKVREDKSTGQDVKMCWKLTSVFGLTWILGLAAGFHIAIRIVYIVCNSLQGVFIMVGFIMTRRILNMYLKKAGKEPLPSTRRRTSSMKSTATFNTTLSSNRKISQLGGRKPIVKQAEPREEAQEIAVNGDSAEVRLIASYEGTETKL